MERHSKSQQEMFWAGDFGTEYTRRNQVDPAGRRAFFKKILGLTGELTRICEFGANRGSNLQAWRLVCEAELTGVEINPAAYEELSQIPRVSAVHSPIRDYQPAEAFDLVFTLGVLIHIPPEELPDTYRRMFEATRRFLLVGEYFNPVPTEIPYRGHGERLWKRDFAGELIDQFPGRLELVDYGFLWSRVEPAFDNITWFLLKRPSDAEGPTDENLV